MQRSHRRTAGRTALGLSAAMCLAFPAVISTSAFADEVPVADEEVSTCSLATSEVTFDAKPDTDLTSLFHTFAATSGKWSGGDGTFSIPLSDGRVAWLFSDSFIGEVTPELTRPLDTAFVNNSFVIQSGDTLESRFPVVEGDPSSLIPAPTDEPKGWYWVGDGMQADDGSIQLIGQRYWSTGEMWGFGLQSNHLARFNPETFELESLDPLPSETGIAWGAGILEDADATYIYGILDGTPKVLHLARVAGHDLGNEWSFWDGSGWSANEADSAPVLNEGAGNEISVTPFEDGYLMITQDTRELFSSDIVAYTSCSPAGPFAERGTIYNMPEQGGNEQYSGNVFAYNAHEHFHLRSDDTLTVSYNVNSFDPDDLYDNTTIYLPRFVEVGYTVTPEGGETIDPVDPPTTPDSKVTVTNRERLSGLDRWGTMQAIASESFKPGVDVAYVASGLNYADALAAAAAGGAHESPVLLTKQDSLPGEAIAELKRLQPGKVVLVGGEGAVSKAVAEQIHEVTGTAPSRLGGADRYATAAKISQDAFKSGAETVYVASGADFPDALAAAAASGDNSAPVLLTGKNDLPAATKAELTRLQPSKVVVVGGKGVVSESVATQAAKAAGVASAERLSGTDRYASAVDISAKSFAPGVPVVYLATGSDFADALAGAAAAGAQGAPVLLVSNTGLTAEVKAELKRLQPAKVVALGGTGVISTTVLQDAMTYRVK